jgi:hypothetical protein
MSWKRLRGTIAGGAAALLAIALFASVANAATPAPGYTQFAGCPSPDENPAIEVCIRSVVKGGHFKMGNKNVPISKPITLSGGTDGNLEHFAFNSHGGLTPVKQLVPGGVIGLTGLDWLVNFLSIEQLQLFAVTELAGTPELLGVTAINLPVKIHLINPVLGTSCYVGSNSNPIRLHLITGTTSPPPPNTPIKGVEPELFFDEATEILHLNNGAFVDNSFAAPGASGCVLTLLGFIPVSINGLVNTASALPSPAGTNTTVQSIDSELVGSFNVYP